MNYIKKNIIILSKLFNRKKKTQMVPDSFHLDSSLVLLE